MSPPMSYKILKNKVQCCQVPCDEDSLKKKILSKLNDWSSWTNIAEGRYGSAISLFDVDRR